MQYNLLKVENFGFCLMRSDYHATWVCANPANLVQEFDDYGAMHLPSFFSDCVRPEDGCHVFLDGIEVIHVFDDKPTLLDLKKVLPEYFL